MKFEGDFEINQEQFMISYLPHLFSIFLFQLISIMFLCTHFY